MSAHEATRISPGAAAYAGAAPPLAGGWARHGAGEPPAVALVKYHLNSAVIAGILFLSALGHRHRIDGPLLALAAIAYVMALEFMTKPRLDRDDAGADWGRILRHRAIEWTFLAGVLLLAGHLLRVAGHFPQDVVLTWFIATPVALAGAHAAARKATSMLMRRASAARRQVIVGANRIGCELAARLAEEPWLGGLAGFFDDRRLGAVAARVPVQAARPLRGPAGLCAPEHGPGHLCLPADLAPSADPRADRRAGRHHGVDLLRARPVGLRPHAGALRRDPRHAVRRGPGDAVLRHDGRAQARERHRPRGGGAVAGAARCAAIASSSGARRRDRCSSGSAATASTAARSSSTSSAP